MKVFSISTAMAASLMLVSSTAAFQTPSLAVTRANSLVVQHAYIPDGFTAESYKKFKAEEAKKQAAAKNLGGLGPRGFKSRSMQSFQEAMEKGEASHLLPVFNAKERIAKGELRPEDIPYMQRGGSWDNSDVKGARNKKNWLRSDKEYADGGYKREQSVSILGSGASLDWTGKRARTGPGVGEVSVKAAKFSKGYKAPNVNDIKNGKAEKKKGFFGLF